MNITGAVFLPAVLMCGFVSGLHAQTPASPASQRSANVLAIYVECKDLACDFDFLRTEIAFATHVRDRQNANVHVLITSQPTADGGTEATLTFHGQNEFAGVDDSLRYLLRPTATADQVRRGITDTIKRGLVRYVNHTSLAEGVTIGYTPPTQTAATSLDDAWNRWTFTTALNGLVNGEESVKSANVGLTVSANRTTDAWKINTLAQTQYNKTTFELTDGSSVVSTQRSHAASTLVAYGVNDHISVGGRASALASTFLNQSFTVRMAPAFEYDVFPYAESTRRMFTIEYSLGATGFRYEEETIFGKRAETLVDERLLVALRLTERWGSVSLSAEASHYFPDFGKNRGIVSGGSDLNLVKGLSLTTFLNIQRVRDQVYLPRRGASAEEILLRQRQLATSYSYSLTFGISYRFGSRYADVVNRRFAGSVGGMTLGQ